MTASVFGQQYSTPFGQNRIQYKQFEWAYYSTNHFDIYYYRGGQDYARQTIEFLEDEFKRLTEILGYAPYAKTKIFIYNSIHELQQSNIGKDGEVYTVGGQTDFVKLQVEIAHPGSAQEFRQDLVYKMSKILIEDMLFGGSLAEIFQSSYLLTLPQWFIDGAARYIAYGWSQEMDDFIRDYLERESIKKLIKIEGEDASLVGQSVWNYIATKYGRSNISNILNLTRIIRNEENSISNTLGVGYRQFLSDWQNFYIKNQQQIRDHYISPEADNEIISKNNTEIRYKNVKMNRSGKRIAYSQNYLGRFKVYVYDVETGKSKKILTSGNIIQGQEIDNSLPLLDWINDDKLGIIYFKRGFLRLTVFDLASGEKFVKNLNRFNQVESFSFNENGRLALISGDVDGQNDIYLVSMRRNAIRRITNDIYDDLDPYFVPGTAAFVFSSNRGSDSIKVKDPSIEALSDNFNLYVYDLDTTQNVLVRLTNTFSRDSKPIAKNEYEIFYLSDQRGITNLFKYSSIDSTFTQLTNYNKGIKDYDLHFNDDELVYFMLEDGLDRVFYKDRIDLDRQVFTPQTARQQLKQARFVANIYNQKQLSKINKKPEKREEPKLVDTVRQKPGQQGIDLLNYQFSGREEQRDNPYEKIENFKFEDDKEQEKFRPESFFSNYERLESNKQIYGPLSYQPEFSFQNLITSFAIDPLRGFGIVVETQVNDLLENHKLTAGGLVITNLRSGDLYAEYEFLKYWLDFKVRLDRNTIFMRDNNEDLLIQKYTLNKFTVGASLPVTNWLRFELNPFYAQTNFNNLQFENVVNRGTQDFAEDAQVHYMGATGRMVFDNTIQKGFNLQHGTRFLLQGDVFQSLNDASKNFSNVRFDFRHYQQIHREITWATRVFYGQFFGPNRQNYLIGGVPNWLFNKTRSHVSGDPLALSNSLNNSNLLFVDYTTNLRGFNYNERFGSSTFLVNTELRIPIFRYLSSAPLSSNFLRNFFMTGFADFGSAWDGPIPLNPDRSSLEVEYDEEIFKARIKNFSNPWLASYGLGVRTLLLGYYARFDYAWPLRDFVPGDPKFTVSVGLDF